MHIKITVWAPNNTTHDGLYPYPCKLPGLKRMGRIKTGEGVGRKGQIINRT
jgi:hypothetical protein